MIEDVFLSCSLGLEAYILDFLMRALGSENIYNRNASFHYKIYISRLFDIPLEQPTFVSVRLIFRTIPEKFCASGELIGC